jgi:hypothetical protein
MNLGSQVDVRLDRDAKAPFRGEARLEKRFPQVPQELGRTRAVTDIRSRRQGAHVGRPDRS